MFCIFGMGLVSTCTPTLLCSIYVALLNKMIMYGINNLHVDFDITVMKLAGATSAVMLVWDVIL